MRSILIGTCLAFGITTAVGSIAAQAGQGQQSQPAGQGRQSQPAAQGEKPAPKPHDMTGCLAKGDTATSYRLTNVEGGKVKAVEITETAANLKMDAHVGHKITITGVGLPAPKEQAAGKKPMGEHYMRVDAMKHVAPTCP